MTAVIFAACLLAGISLGVIGLRYLAAGIWIFGCVAIAATASAAMFLAQRNWGWTVLCASAAVMNAWNWQDSRKRRRVAKSFWGAP